MLKIVCAIVFSLFLNSCVSSAMTSIADNLSQAILNQNDPETVRDGAPAYLVMIDGLIEGDPENTDLLLTGAKLYGSYTSAFVDDESRSRRLAKKSFDYAKRALCLEAEDFCTQLDSKLEPFKASLSEVDEDEIKLLYQFSVAWAGWVQVNSSDWNALADLSKLTALFEHTLLLDEAFDDGGAHVYLGVLGSQLPPSLGGKPDLARAHFERAIEISGGRNLMFSVLMAEHYARLVFDQEMHDSLLASVQRSDAEYNGYTLVNTIAKIRAEKLLAGSPDFF
ncbi:MAG: hypothetical protein ACI9LO_002004 [Planctomycetota bacterium]|jgi:hypothetical protein